MASPRSDGRLLANTTDTEGRFEGIKAARLTRTEWMRRSWSVEMSSGDVEQTTCSTRPSLLSSKGKRTHSGTPALASCPRRSSGGSWTAGSLRRAGSTITQRDRCARRTARRPRSGAEPTLSSSMTPRSGRVGNPTGDLSVRARSHRCASERRTRRAASLPARVMPRRSTFSSRRARRIDTTVSLSDRSEAPRLEPLI